MLPAERRYVLKQGRVQRVVFCQKAGIPFEIDRVPKCDCRPAKLSAKEIKTTRALLKTADIPVAEIAARFGVARSTLYRTVKRPT